MKINLSRAFTLVEVLISVVISAVVLESIYVTLFLGQKAWTNYSNNALPKQEIRRGLMSMIAELREATNPFIVRDAHSSRINFDRPFVGPVSYIWSDSGDNANRIIRTNNDHQRILAKDISSLSFTLPFDNQLFISIAGKQNFSMKEEVTLREKTSLFLQGQNEAVK